MHFAIEAAQNQQRVHGVNGAIRNTTTRYCIFSLDTTSIQDAKSPQLLRFMTGPGSQSGKVGGSFERLLRGMLQVNLGVRNRVRALLEVRWETGGGKRAVFAGMDRAVYQSGVFGPWPLAACRRFRRRTLLQLQRATSQCSAAARPSPAATSSLTRQLPSPGSFSRASSVTSAAEPDGPARPGEAGASRPRRNLLSAFCFL